MTGLRNRLTDSTDSEFISQRDHRPARKSSDTINTVHRDEYAMRQPLLQLCCGIKLRDNVDEQNMRGFSAIVQLNPDICLLHLKRVSVSNRFLDFSGFHVSHICCQRANNFAYNIYLIKSLLSRKKCTVRNILEQGKN